MGNNEIQDILDLHPTHDASHHQDAIASLGDRES